MANALVIQSGEPTAVMNASLVGVIHGCEKYSHYEKLYGGVNGIEGTLKDNIVDLSIYEEKDLSRLKNTPSAGLGVSHYTLQPYAVNEEEYLLLVNVMKKYDITSIIVIGNRMAMDLVNKLRNYFEEKALSYSIVGVPNDYKNEIFDTNHSPGFGSAAKYIASILEEIALDARVYSENGVYIVETMGEETGWLAASSALAQIEGKYIVDLIYFPEINFLERKFIDDVIEIYSHNQSVVIVVAEGAKDLKGNLLGSYINPRPKDFQSDDFSGAGEYLKNIIIGNNITTNVRVIQLGVTQRSAMHFASQIDVEEAYALGIESVSYAVANDSGKMMCINRLNNDPYEVVLQAVDVKISAEMVKHFPEAWIDMGANFVTQEALDYMEPLIQGLNELDYKDGLPNFFEINKK